MLRKVTLEPKNESFLAGYRLAPLSFEATILSYSSLNEVWELIRAGSG